MTRYHNESNNVRARFDNWLPYDNAKNVENIVAIVWNTDPDQLPNFIENLDIPLSNHFFIEHLFNIISDLNLGIKFDTYEQLLLTDRIIFSNLELTQAVRAKIKSEIDWINDFPSDFEEFHSDVVRIVELALYFNERALDSDDNQTNAQQIPIPTSAIDFYAVIKKGRSYD